MNRLRKIRGVYYKWNDLAKKRSPTLKDSTNVGFIAQEMQAMFPELVSKPDKDGYIGIYYSQVAAVVAEAVKELADNMDERLEALARPEKRHNKRHGQIVTDAEKTEQDLLDRLDVLERSAISSPALVPWLLLAVVFLLVTNAMLLAGLAFEKDRKRIERDEISKA